MCSFLPSFKLAFISGVKMGFTGPLTTVSRDCLFVDLCLKPNSRQAAKNPDEIHT